MTTIETPQRDNIKWNAYYRVQAISQIMLYIMQCPRNITNVSSIYLNLREIFSAKEWTTPTRDDDIET